MLRVIASISVVMIHVAQTIWYTADINTSLWKWSNVYEAFSKWAVPVFVMISGAGILNSAKSFEEILNKNVRKILKVFFLWAMLYFAESYLLGKPMADCVLSVIYGPLWYLLMTVGLYLIVPFCRLIVKCRKLTDYFLLLGIIFTCILPTGKYAAMLLSEKLYKGLSMLEEDFGFFMCVGFSVYFILGYGIAAWWKDEKNKTRLVYVLGAIGFVVNPLLGEIATVLSGKVFASFYDNFNIFVFIEAVAVFLLLMNYHKLLVKSGFAKLSKYTLTIYLIHKIVIDLFGLSGVNWYSFGSVLSVPVYTVAVWASSLLFAVSLDNMQKLLARKTK